MSKLNKSEFKVKTLSLKNQGHQGDVFIQKVAMTVSEFKNAIKTAVKKPSNNMGLTVVLEGEGHNMHALESDIADVYEVPSDIPGIQRFLAKITDECLLQHVDTPKEALSGEHNTIVLQPGYYEFRSQRQRSTNLEDLEKSIEQRIQSVTD